MSFLNTYQQQVIEYGGGGGGNEMYYVGVPVSVSSGSSVLYTLAIDGAVGSFFQIFMSGYFSGSTNTININVGGVGTNFSTTASGGSFQLQQTIFVASTTEAKSTLNFVDNSSISISSPQSVVGGSTKFANGTYSLDLTAPTSYTVTATRNVDFQVYSFTINKYTAPPSP